jgi:glyoxylase-like metal-dependent hydrolase (beta-lactamase superfamily II)
MITVGPIRANCYLVYDENTKEAMVVDPGAEGARIHKEIARLELKVKYLVNTHGHHDHIGGNQYLREATGAPVCIHKADSLMISSPQKNLSFFFAGQQVSSPEPYQDLEEGDILEFGGLRFKVLHTPGHSPGGICLVGHGVCFSGDTLFAESIGRTDLPGGSTEELFTSIRGKLFILAETTVVYPGHGSQTTIGHEKTDNPFLR